jgi:hypothetical protein
VETYLRQQAERLLAIATDAFVERAVHRCGGPQPALERLRDDPNGDGLWVDAFTSAFLTEELLDNPDGAAFVLRAFPRRQVTASVTGTVSDVLLAQAHQVLSDLVVAKADQALQQALVWQEG